MDNNDIENVERRIRRYWYGDGIAELASGGLFTLLGIYYWIQVAMGENSPISVFLQVILVLVLFIGFVGVRWLVQTLKVHLTYPRTGYVEYRVNDREVKRRRWLIVLAAAIVSGMSIVLDATVHSLDSVILIIGILSGVIFIAFWGRASGIKRFYVLGGLAIVLGVALSLNPYSQRINLAIYFGFLGIVTITSGVFILYQYMNENPPRQNNNYG